MFVYVVTDGETDYMFTVSQTEVEAYDKLEAASRARRVLIDPRKQLWFRRLTGWSHEMLAALDEQEQG